MRWLNQIFGFLVGIGVGASIAPSYEVLTVNLNRLGADKEIEFALNKAKSGDSTKSRMVLESRLITLDAMEASLLATYYAVGEGGPVDEGKALALARIIGCKHRPFGKVEFEISNQLLVKDRKRSLEWLIRSAEAGFQPARLQLSKIETPELRNLSVYWKKQMASALPTGTESALSDCKN